MTEPTAPCPSSPAGESHRWRLPAQGTTGPAICKYCGASKVFDQQTAPNRWEAESQGRQERAMVASKRTKAAKRQGADDAR
jgi:hypothetical protein